MKVSENTVPVPSALPQPEWPASNRPVAPWWHTVLIAAIIIGVSVFSGMHAKALETIRSSHIHRYLVTIVWEWVLALLTLWGIHIRRTPLRQIFGVRRNGLREFAVDFGIALVFWVVAIVILGALAALLRLVHLAHAQKVVVAIAPQTLPQIIVWLLLCATAGIVEEFVFRGYLLQQFSSLGTSLSLRGKLIIGIVASSLLFGSAHGYEGIGGMIVITAYGALFCILAIYRRSLRAGMIAHAWHDSIAGIAIAVLKHMRVF
ncbi:MAG TPA: CPBP family intramembrane glutamic endopeptidase [Acidobacteriaceae bacterium]|nr:CPBP family intramembrane glutamic endopeptidase [Acidobacteriaceae bacterium]